MLIKCRIFVRNELVIAEIISRQPIKLNGNYFHRIFIT